MKKRVSKRRWKARLKLGLWVPYRACVEHDLLRSFYVGQTMAWDHRRDLVRWPGGRYGGVMDAFDRLDATIERIRDARR